VSGDGSYIDELDGRLDARGRAVALVTTRFHGEITEALLEAARACLAHHGARDDHLRVIRVPGAWELPLAVQAAAASRTVDAVVALGCVVRGETPHFDYICQEVARGLGAASRETGVPVAFGVLTTETEGQARVRAGLGDGAADNSPGRLRSSKGWEAALAVLEMMEVVEEIGEWRRAPGRSAPGFATPGGEPR
jgi:6,7-dimethyl-8-ribityllumazine synthase